MNNLIISQEPDKLTIEANEPIRIGANALGVEVLGEGLKGGFRGGTFRHERFDKEIVGLRRTAVSENGDE